MTAGIQIAAEEQVELRNFLETLQINFKWHGRTGNKLVDRTIWHVMSQMDKFLTKSVKQIIRTNPFLDGDTDKSEKEFLHLQCGEHHLAFIINLYSQIVCTMTGYSFYIFEKKFLTRKIHKEY